MAVQAAIHAARGHAHPLPADAAILFAGPDTTMTVAPVAGPPAPYVPPWLPPPDAYIKANPYPLPDGWEVVPAPLIHGGARHGQRQPGIFMGALIDPPPTDPGARRHHSQRPRPGWIPREGETGNADGNDYVHGQGVALHRLAWDPKANGNRGGFRNTGHCVGLGRIKERQRLQRGGAAPSTGNNTPRIEPGADELAPRSALTLERQALFLRLLWPRVPIVPCLVSAPPRGPRGASHAPGPRDAHEDAVAACERALALEGDTLVLVASDLGRALAEHAGPEVHRLASDDQRAARERDKRAVDAALAFDAAAFWNEASLDAGTTSSNPLPLWLALRLCQPRRAATAELGHLRGSVLGYQQLPGRGELTTAASLVFHRESREAEELRDQSPPSPSSSPSSPE